MQVYVDNKLLVNSPSSSLNEPLTLSKGPHFVVTKAWDESGADFVSDRDITIYSGTPGETCSASTGTRNVCLRTQNEATTTSLHVFAIAASSGAQMTASTGRHRQQPDRQRHERRHVCRHGIDCEGGIALGHSEGVGCEWELLFGVEEHNGTVRNGLKPAADSSAAGLVFSVLWFMPTWWCGVPLCQTLPWLAGASASIWAHTPWAPSHSKREAWQRARWP